MLVRGPVDSSGWVGSAGKFEGSQNSLDPRLITATPLDPTFIIAALLLSMPEHARSVSTALVEDTH